MYNPVPPKSPHPDTYAVPSATKGTTKKTNAATLIPWLLTLVLHGLIFAAAYFLYMRTIQQNSAATVATKVAPKTTVQAISTTATTQPASATTETLKTITEPNQPIAITEEKYLPSPRVRADLPILTAASIAAADPSKAAQRAVQDQIVDELTKMAIGPLGVPAPNVATAATNDKTPANTIAPTLNPVLTDRDVPEQEKRALQKNGQPVNADKNVKAQSKTQKADSRNKSSPSKGNKTVANAADSVDDTNDELSKNIDLVKNKNRQKIAKEFGTTAKTKASEADDTLQEGIDEPANVHGNAHKTPHAK